MKTRRAWVGSAGLALSLALSSVPARAQGAASSAVAEALFQQGRDLFQHGSYPEACGKFAESQRIEPRLGTLLRLALCHEKTGQTATAWAEFTSAMTIAQREGQRDREKLARSRVAALEKVLPRITVEAAVKPAGMTIQLDDATLDLAALDTPLPIDPGKHHVVVSAPGKSAWSSEFDVPPRRADILVQVPVLGDRPAPEPATEPVTPPAEAPPPAVVTLLSPPSEPSPRPPSLPAPLPAPASPAGPAKPLAYAGFSVGAAGLLVGAVTGSVAFATSRDLVQTCTHGHCQPSQAGALHGVDAVADVANVAFALGAVGVGIGVTGVVLGRGREAARSGGIFVGPGTIELAGSF